MSQNKLEIIEYIENSDYDEKLKNFFKNAVIYELMYPGKFQFKAKYEKFIETALEDVLKDIESDLEE